MLPEISLNILDIAENSVNAKQQIISDIEFIAQQMENNKQQIEKLQAQLDNSSAIQK